MIRTCPLFAALFAWSLASSTQVAWCLASSTQAQTGALPVLSPVAFEYDAYYRQGGEETGDDSLAVAAAGGEPYAATSVTGRCCGMSCGSIDCGDGCDCGDACGGGSACYANGLFSGCGCIGGLEGKSLAAALGLDHSRWDVGGWTQFGYHDGVTPRATAAGARRSRSFNDNPHNLNLHQQWLYVEKQTDGSRGLDVGGRFDVLYGIDSRKAQAIRNPPGSFDEDWNHGVYGWAIPQLYGELAAGDASVKIGRFLSPIGYERIPAPTNFFYSHALTLVGSEPLTMTGVLGSYTGFDSVTLFGGWTAGWDTGFDSRNSGSNWVGGVAVDLLDSVTLTYMNAYGNFGQRDGGNDDSYSHSIVLQAGLTDNLVYIGQTDMYESSLQNEDSVGLNQYLFYSLSDVLLLGQRLEWWKLNGSSFYEATSGVNVHLLENLVFRPEYRKDWSPATGLDEDTLGMDMILTY